MNDAMLVWILTGIVLVVFELMFSGMVVLFFALGSFTVGFLALIPWCAELIWLQIVVFILVSAIGLFMLRKPCMSVFSGTVFDPNGSWFWKKGGSFDGSFGDSPSFVKGNHICHNAIGRMSVNKALTELKDDSRNASPQPGDPSPRHARTRRGLRR